MRFLRFIAAAGLLSAIATPGLGQMAAQDSATVNRSSGPYPCTTFTDVCYATSKFDEMSTALISLRFEGIQSQGRSRHKSWEPLHELPPESGLEILEAVFGVDEREGSRYLSAHPDLALPDSWNLLRQADNSTIEID